MTQGYRPWWAGLAPLVPSTTDPRVVTGVEGKPPGLPVSWPAETGELAPWQPTEQELHRWGDAREIICTNTENPIEMLCDVARLRVPQAVLFSCTVNLITTGLWTVPIDIIADIGIGRARSRAIILTIPPTPLTPNVTLGVQLAVRATSISAQFRSTTLGNPERARVFGGIGLFGGAI